MTDSLDRPSGKAGVSVGGPVDISVIVPTFNESENLPILVPALLAVLAPFRAEIIIVDDDSPDGTWQIADKFAQSNSRIRSIRRVSDRGLSSAVLAGMAVATGQALAVIDSDLQHDEQALPALLTLVLSEDFDVAVGSRDAAGGSYGDWSKWRRFVSWGGKQLAKRILSVEVSDPMSGYFVVSRAWYEELRVKVNPRGFKILLEFVARGRTPRLAEVGYGFRTRQHGQTKLTGSVVGSFVVALLDLFVGRIISSTFTAYAIVGALGVAVRYSTVAGLDSLGVASAAFGGFLASVGSNYVLHNRFTFRRYAFEGRAHLTGFARFFAVSLHGLLVQAGVSTLAEERYASASELLVGLFGIVIATAGNYLLHSTITWRAHRKAAF